VPTCVSCHGVHNVKGPRDPSFRDNSITTCGNCHTDKERMAKYGISTDVYDTYVNDFHGRTVDLARSASNALPSNKAVCYDCHGIHNILPPTDPKSTVNPANLMTTCQQCHPDANSRFPTAWLGHKNPSFDNTPALYGVQLFYKLIIPATLGFFGVYIVLDWSKRRRERRAAYQRAMAETEEEIKPAQPAPQAPTADETSPETTKDESSEDDKH
jgi:5-methylcytosine-specific restriction endonuclease McrA